MAAWYTSFNCAAPFRERLSASISGRSAKACSFNCAAPFRERLLPHSVPPPAGGTVGFNCAAPFRERLSANAVRTMYAGNHASIVPLPFGSGYMKMFTERVALGIASIVPLPFGSGYSSVATESTVL